MARGRGRAYVFVRWSGSSRQAARLGEVAWAFEYNDRLGRFNCFYYGAAEAARVQPRNSPLFPYGKCLTLPELTKAMSREGFTKAGFDEVKVFEIEEADPETALQFLVQRSVAPDELAARVSSIEETREILLRYGVRGLANSRGFSAPFLWYNMLPGRSVPIRKLPVHLFQLRISADAEKETSASSDVEGQIRKLAESDPEVLGLGECFIARVDASFVVGLSVAVDQKLTVGEGRTIAERIELSIRRAFPKVSRVFTQIEAFQSSEID
jgi:hypothetical protein